MHTNDAGEKRVALVIGNAAYRQGPLANPVNDARAMATQLRQLGFETIVKENLKQREIGSVYREFRNKISPGGVALVFYAGHGMQIRGQNFFPAVDSDISSEEDVPLHSVNLGTLLENMEEAKAGVSIVLLDACRDNPYTRRFRSATRGLAKVQAASGTLIHYATKPGSVAADGEGKNGTYTEALLAQMREPGVPVEMMLKTVANKVVEVTQGKQEPWIEGSLRGDFYFVNRPTIHVNVPTPPAPDPEVETWLAAQTANAQAAYETYLLAYPNGRFAAAARIKLIALQKPAPKEPAAVSERQTAPAASVSPVNALVAAPSNAPVLPVKPQADVPAASKVTVPLKPVTPPPVVAQPAEPALSITKQLIAEPVRNENAPVERVGKDAKTAPNDVSLTAQASFEAARARLHALKAKAGTSKLTLKDVLVAIFGAENAEFERKATAISDVYDDAPFRSAVALAWGLNGDQISHWSFGFRLQALAEDRAMSACESTRQSKAFQNTHPCKIVFRSREIDFQALDDLLEGIRDQDFQAWRTAYIAAQIVKPTPTRSR